ncbi:hypothetical protein SAMN05444487_10629 [Marininema mesophilum]|uniref:Uncharacterized protein n=1 Tax=Marininema mesophilum TaxID=1048340 RepID=A0A1H2W6A6_9BACL|nr:hypothetical protein [Marininema mesophilum]SDW76055.1 hypothetical protein SAMN05444487_10629 [Marininema mesophilum]
MEVDECVRRLMWLGSLSGGAAVLCLWLSSVSSGTAQDWLYRCSLFFFFLLLSITCWVVLERYLEERER